MAYKVYLSNPKAGCRIVGEGRTKRAAFDRAVKLARPEFMMNKGSVALELFAGAAKSINGKPHITRVSLAEFWGGFDVEIVRASRNT